MCDGCQEFFKKHAGVVKAAALAHASAFVDYADLAQMVFVKVLEWKQKQIDPIEISPGFLYTIASNLAISEWRKRKREAQLEPQHLDVYENRIDPDKETNPEIKILVDQIMSKIKDPRDKDAVFSWYTDEPLGAFASRHDLTKANASVVRFRAVKRLSNEVVALHRRS